MTPQQQLQQIAELVSEPAVPDGICRAAIRNLLAGDGDAAEVLAFWRGAQAEQQP